MHASVPPASTASASPRRMSSARLADRVRAGRAGRDDRVVRAADPERDRDLAARRVDEDVRQEERRDAVRAALAQHVGLLQDPENAADRGAEDDPDARRVEAVEPGVRDAPRFAAATASSDVPVEPARLLRRHDARRIEVLDLGGDAHGELARVERADQVDAAPPRERRLHVDGASLPSGVTAPSPVTTTLRTTRSLDAVHRVTKRRARVSTW